MRSERPKMIHQFCLEIRAINGSRHALILGFSRSRATYEVVNLETGKLTEPQIQFCITRDSYDEYIMLVTQGRYDTLLKEVLTSRRANNAVYF
ncbi:hypothetical protein J4413_03050 [Candidatus Woesearchaeota archaeon]|nr:hypothetical protein [Candidatus Woesearchaeota archaeon]